MSGEKDLQKLLRQMEPVKQPGSYVFVSTPVLGRVDPAELTMIFREAEGYTLILERSRADHLGLTYAFISTWITLSVHSSLEAVGLTAAVSNALSDAGISCNVVAGFYHDHLFVPESDAEAAMNILKNLHKQIN